MDIFFEIDVTQDDINNGLRCDADRCPIAIAVHRHEPLKDALICGVFGKDEISGRPLLIRHLPPEAKLFVVTFDQGLPVTPFKFKLTSFPKKLLEKLVALRDSMKKDIDGSELEAGLEQRRKELDALYQAKKEKRSSQLEKMKPEDILSIPAAPEPVNAKVLEKVGAR